MPATSDLPDLGSLPESLERHSRLLWWLGIGFYGVGDTLTTVAGLWAGRGVEAGPVVGTAMQQFGLPGLFLVKVAALAGFYLAWRVVRSPGRVGIPLALAVVGVAVTGWNGVVLFSGDAWTVGWALVPVGGLP